MPSRLGRVQLIVVSLLLAGCYAGGREQVDAGVVVDLNSAPAEVILANLCEFVSDQELCQDTEQIAMFTELLRTVRTILPEPPFGSSEEFLAFVEGKGEPRDLYPTLTALLGQESPLLAWTPIVIADEIRSAVLARFTVRA